MIQPIIIEALISIENNNEYKKVLSPRNILISPKKSLVSYDY